MSNIHIEEDQDGLLINGRRIYINKESKEFVLEEHTQNPTNSAIHQFASIEKLPGLIDAIGLPDFHIGYALPIGSIAVIDLEREDASVSPDGIGFDINCGVRFLKTNLNIKDFGKDKREEVADRLIEKIPYDENKDINMSITNFNEILDKGMKYFLERGLIPKEDLEHTESTGSLEGNSSLIGQKSKHRGMTQIGTLGSGNHYLEIEVVDEIFDREAAEAIKLTEGQIVISIHTGSRGLGHGSCTEIMEEIKNSLSDDKDYIKNEFRKVSESEMSKEEKRVEYDRIKMELSQKRKKNTEKDPLQFVRVDSPLGRRYLTVMNTASNYAWANRTLITEGVRSILKEMFEDVQIEVVSDICHNVGKIEEIDGKEYLVHRKGASRILPPNHPEIVEEYRRIGQPVLVGGSMGTCSYLVVGSEGSSKTFYSTCHGAGRQVSRQKSKKKFNKEEVIEEMRKRDIVFRVGNEEGIVEECAGCYKDVEEVVKHSEKVGISRRVCRVTPILVIKG